VIESGSCRATIEPGGWLSSLQLNRTDGWEAVRFRADTHRGPAWHCHGKRVDLAPDPSGPASFTGESDGLRFSLRYELREGKLAIIAGLRNPGTVAVGPLAAGLCLGLDTCMEKFPDWNDRYFPTLLRCEKTHFWGYAMTPRGRILGISSPDPVASWHLSYNPGGHRIHTLTLDLLNPPPLPARHPAGLDRLAPGEEKQWTIYLEAIPSLDQLQPRLAVTTGAPMIACDRYTVACGEMVKLTVFGDRVMEKSYRPDDAPGVYTLTEKANGKVAEAMISVRHPWSWYLKAARREALAKPQKASSHTESWYGLFSCFLARQHYPDPALDAAAEAKFREIWPLMYDLTTMAPSSWQERIQNHACAAGLLAARYRATGDLRDLEFAASLADFILTKQTADGAYRCHKTHYTSVIYVGKSLLEVMAEEKTLAADPVWRARYERHFASVRRAMDNLTRNLDNIETEGEMTYEDGMIGCSATQLAMFALWQEEPAERQKYLDAALHFANGHRCLSQILIPDSRMNGGSLRFWESQYDILTTPNMLNSPHGWSAWRIYGLWYLYQLTGATDYLRQTMNALGSCVQLIDGDSGELRWAFVTDPQIQAQHFEEFPDRPGKGRCVPRVIGEQYLPMISGWFKAPTNTWVSGYWGGNPLSKLPAGESWPNVFGKWWSDPGKAAGGKDHPEVYGGDGGCCDNDVHEIFKCLEEVALTSAYVVESNDGTIETWNCTAAQEAGALRVKPAEAVVDRVHFNLRQPQVVAVEFAGGEQRTAANSGMQWVRK